MLYLIGGAPRVGKSTLANLILERNKIAYTDADWIVSMLMFAAPQLGIKYAADFTTKAYIKKANNFYPYIYQFIKYNQPVVEKYVIEGDSFLPEHVAKLQKEFMIKSCFLGTSSLKPEILLDNPSKNDWWIKKLSPEELSTACRWIVDVSAYLENECEKHNITYFDMAKNYSQQLEAAYGSLL